ncbi:hypothetical protein OS242_10480 [Tumebacillus sp. DT12]|uniref:HTH merR-type domain-containing protein n=1 Tax=Tumebacillus lacus TaxID=2995335 RepID=A0ABT3X0G1_9BACL|nr:hypothetical protein [Tumebacillus lacus]MCX7570389.1 hypothetical protein [Tumebacillus lacus]
MKLGEVAKKLGITTNDVKNETAKMEDEGVVFKRINSYRDYSEDDIKTIAQRRGIEYPPKSKEFDDLMWVANQIPEEKRAEVIAYFLKRVIG